MRYLAIEIENHSETTTAHLVKYGAGIYGEWGTFRAYCGRYITGAAWDHGTVDGPRCMQCAAKQVKREAREAARQGIR